MQVLEVTGEKSHIISSGWHAIEMYVNVHSSSCGTEQVNTARVEVSLVVPCRQDFSLAYSLMQFHGSSQQACHFNLNGIALE